MLRLRSIYIASTSHDHTWDNVGAASWSAVEVNTGIICAALPTIKPLIARIFPRFLTPISYTQPTHSRHSQSTPAAIFRASNCLRTTVGASGIPMRDSQFASTWGHPGGIKVDFALTQEVERRDPRPTDDEAATAGSVASIGSLGGAASEADSEKGLVLKP
ncbi:MAG: hypothetical protein M1840_009034 [Geoglossum simile]|nr:MAG: hypothetical protein M1840_009034 [Geoglossum simile]